MYWMFRHRDRENSRLAGAAPIDHFEDQSLRVIIPHGFSQPNTETYLELFHIL